MATPYFRVQTIAPTFMKGQSGSLRINTFDADGAPVDVSSGYTLQKFNLTPPTGFNPNSSIPDVSASFTATFDATGLTLTWTAAQGTTLQGTPKQQTAFATVLISNDSGTTKQLVAQGNVNCPYVNNALA